LQQRFSFSGDGWRNHNPVILNLFWQDAP
jgi:hypothetical protein